MPFIDDTAQREQDQRITPFEYQPESSFGETFAAALGQVFDEESSISSMLNREGEQDRRDSVSRLIADGKVKRERYTDVNGKFDYDRLARELNDPSVKTDEQVREERNKMLAARREYADDVIERGSGVAQFLGAATGYITDPVSLATLPIATAGVAARGLGVLGRALLTARNAAVIEASTEMVIQGFVYQHKHDIDSPWSEKDAIMNIATAAIGAGALGLVSGGIGGYLRKVRGEVDKLDRVSPDVRASKEVIERLETRLGDVKIGDVTAKAEADFIESIKPTATKAELKKLDKGIIPKKYETELNRVKTEKIVEAEVEYLNKLDVKRQEVNQPSVKPENFEGPPKPPPPQAKAITREREAMQAMGLEKDYDIAMDNFSKLDDPIMADEAGNVIDAKAFMTDIDDQLSGLDSVLVCARG